MENSTLAGRGLYSISDASRIIHADTRSLQRWASGYHRHTKKAKIFVRPILNSEILEIDGTEFLSFRQIIEMLFIRLLRQYKVSMPVIRAAARRAAQQFHTAYPFAVESLKTEGESIFHLTLSDIETDSSEQVTQAQIVQDLCKAQIVIGEFAEPYFHKINYAALYASEYWPLGKDRHIVIDPARSFGEPIDNESGVPTRIINGMYVSGDNIDLIGRSYNVRREAVLSAIEFENSLLDKAA